MLTKNREISTNTPEVESRHGERRTCENLWLWHEKRCDCFSRAWFSSKFSSSEVALSPVGSVTPLDSGVGSAGAMGLRVAGSAGGVSSDATSEVLPGEAALDSTQKSHYLCDVFKRFKVLRERHTTGEMPLCRFSFSHFRREPWRHRARAGFAIRHSCVAGGDGLRGRDLGELAALGEGLHRREQHLECGGNAEGYTVIRFERRATSVSEERLETQAERLCRGGNSAEAFVSLPS